MNLYRREQIAWLMVTALGLVCSMLLVLGGLVVSRASAEGKQAPVRVSATEVLRDPQRFVGRPLSVEGEVATVLGNQAFTLHSNAAPLGLLVVLTHEAPSLGAGRLQPGQRVCVHGALRPLTRRELQTLENALDRGADPAERLAMYANYPYALALTASFP